MPVAALIRICQGTFVATQYLAEHPESYLQLSKIL